MSTTTQFPTSNTVHTGGWTSPTDAYSDNGVYATCAPPRNGNTSTDFGTFGFDAIINSGSTITSVTVEYQYKCDFASPALTMGMSYVVGGSHGTLHTDTGNPLADRTVTLDITADRSWTRADLLDATFLVHIESAKGNTSSASSVNLDYVKVTVVYTPGAGFDPKVSSMFLVF